MHEPEPISLSSARTPLNFFGVTDQFIWPDVDYIPERIELGEVGS
jgi:hypothetical protein